MNKSAQPYKLGNGGTVGGTAAKAGAEIGTAISEGVQAVSSVKKHRNALDHIASENALNRQHVKDAATHFAGIAKELGGNTRIESDADGAVRFKNKKGKKNKNKNLSSAQQDGPSSTGGTRQGTGSVRAPGTPKSIPRGSGAGVRSGAVVRPSAKPMRALPPGKPETKPANATVKPMLALPAGKSSQLKADNAASMKNFNQKKQEVRQRAAAERAAGNRPKRSTPRTVAGKKRSAADQRIADWQKKYNGKMDDWHARTVANIDRAAAGK